MKKLLAILLSGMLLIGLAACGSSSETEAEDSLASGSDTSTTVAETKKTESADGDYEWEEFIADYEAWADDYIAMVKKYKENPTDLSILADYTEMAADMVEWSEKADEIQSDLTPAQAAEYSKKLLEISGKLAEAAY